MFGVFDSMTQADSCALETNLLSAVPSRCEVWYINIASFGIGTLTNPTHLLNNQNNHSVRKSH